MRVARCVPGYLEAILSFKTRCWVFFSPVDETPHVAASSGPFFLNSLAATLVHFFSFVHSLAGGATQARRLKYSIVHASRGWYRIRTWYTDTVHGMIPSRDTRVFVIFPALCCAVYLYACPGLEWLVLSAMHMLG